MHNGILNMNTKIKPIQTKKICWNKTSKWIIPHIYSTKTGPIFKCIFRIAFHDSLDAHLQNG